LWKKINIMYIVFNVNAYKCHVINKDTLIRLQLKQTYFKNKSFNASKILIRVMCDRMWQ